MTDKCITGSHMHSYITDGYITDSYRPVTDSCMRQEYSSLLCNKLVYNTAV